MTIIIVITIVTFNSTFKCNIKGPISSPPPTPKSELKIPTVNANSGNSKLNSAQLISPIEINNKLKLSITIQQTIIIQQIE